MFELRQVKNEQSWTEFVFLLGSFNIVERKMKRLRKFLKTDKRKKDENMICASKDEEQKDQQSHWQIQKHLVVKRSHLGFVMFRD